ncbi:MAG: hypothetical protein MK132_03990 [Lentisphaerales bacterium]|nr:hypothetical protein [Lentisphaerales bacterium]
MKKLVLLVVSLFALNLSASTIQNIDFTGNALPSNWDLITTRDGRINNERLEAYPVDGSALIFTDVPLGLDRISISFDAQFRDSYWGSYSQVHLSNVHNLEYNFTHGFNEYTHGRQNFTHINKSYEGHIVSDFQAAEFDIFSYEIEMVDGKISYMATN